MKTLKTPPDKKWMMALQPYKNERCDYKIPQGTLIQFLDFFGEVKSEVMEDLFDEGGNPDY
jgi:hypothetical protein